MEVSFIDMITPSDIAYVICLVKNGKDMWDQKIQQMESGDDAEKKLRPLYTGGQGKRKELGKSLFSNEGVKIFKWAEKKWKEMYKNENMMRILYRGFEDWLNDVRKQIKVGDNSYRTYHLVMAMWRAEEMEDNKAKKGGKAVPSNNSDESTNESDDNDNNKEYMSDSGLRLLSKKWLKEEMERKKRSKENDRDARASSPTGGARSSSKKATASPSHKAAATSPKGGKRSPTIEVTASPSPKAAASNPKGGERSPTKKATASPSQGTPGRNNKRKETAISPSAGSLQGKKRRGASPKKTKN